MKKLFWLPIVILLTACGADRSSLATYQKTNKNSTGLADNYKPTYSRTEEYVTRVAKRVSIVSDHPNDNIQVQVTESSDAIFELDRETNSIQISTGVLQQLKDEAQLAAAMSLGMARLNNVPDPDRETVNTLCRAGYDPYAMLDLEEKYFYAAQTGQDQWMSTIFPVAPTAGDINANKALIDKMPKGLQRGEESYFQQINGQT